MASPDDQATTDTTPEGLTAEEYQEYLDELNRRFLASISADG